MRQDRHSPLASWPEQIRDVGLGKAANALPLFIRSARALARWPAASSQFPIVRPHDPEAMKATLYSGQLPVASGQLASFIIAA